jgi:hypothetical protein
MDKGKKYVLGFLVILIGSVGLFYLVTNLTGCQAVTKDLGGTTTITLEPGEKLEEITWKDDSLWYLTRPMRSDESPERHEFKQSTNFGVLEGTVIIIESR